MPLKIGPFYLGKPTSEDIAAVELAAASLPSNFSNSDSFHEGVTRAAPPLPLVASPGGWTVDHNRVMVGKGKAAYNKARRLLEQWRHFDLGWASVHNTPPLKKDTPVVVTAFSLLCWTCNPLRISYVDDGDLRRFASSAQKEQLPPWIGAPPGAAQGASLRQQRRQQRWPGSLLAAFNNNSGNDNQATQQQQQQESSAAVAVAAARPPRGRRFAFAHSTLQGHQIKGEERFSVAWNQQDDSVWYEIFTVSRPATLIATAAYPLLRACQRKFAADSCDAMQREMAAADKSKASIESFISEIFERRRV